MASKGDDGDRVVMRTLKSSSDKFRIRPAERSDAADIMRLIHELAVYEKEPESVKIDLKTLEEDGFPTDGSTPLYKAAMAQVIDADTGAWKSVGYALWFFSYSTWEGRTLWLEDLYVEPAHRGSGIGKAMIEYTARESHAAKCERFQWYVLEWNTPSIEFYKSLGARLLPDWRFVRMNAGEVAAFLDKVDGQLASAAS